MGVSRVRAGFTIVEVLIAAILLGLLAVGVGRVMGTSTVTAREERHKLNATLIANAELARLRAAGALALAAADTFRVDRLGQSDAAGPYQVEVEAAVRCEGGVEPYDNSAEPNPFGDGCGGLRPIGVVGVRVRYPTDAAPLGGDVRYELALGWTSVHADSLGGR